MLGRDTSRPCRLTPSLIRRLAFVVGVLMACSGCSPAPDDDEATREGKGLGPEVGQVVGHEAERGDPAPAPVMEPRSAKRITIAMNGDMLLHEGLWASARMDAARTGRGTMDFRPLLENMRPFIRHADLSICHLETPLGPAAGPYSGYPLFSAPPQIVPALRWAGFDACTTASNHSVDRGFEGIERTARALDDAGLARTGAAVSRREAGRARVVLVKGVEVALLSATFGLNGLFLPEGKPWAVNVIDADRLIRQAREARRAGAAVVLVALHWGDEYVNEPSVFQQDVARKLAASGQFDLIYGHHAHVVQPYDRIAGTWVLYGQGNAVAQQDAEVDGLYEGNTARVTFERRSSGRFAVVGVEYTPTLLTRFSPSRPMRYLNVSRALTQRRFRGLWSDLEDTLARVRAIIGSAGAFGHGVKLAPTIPAAWPTVDSP